MVVVAAYVGNDIAENVLGTDFGYHVDPNHPKGLTFGAGASELVQDSISWFPRNGPAGELRGSVPPDPVTSLKTTGRAVWDAARADSLFLGALFGAPPDPGVSTAPGARAPSRGQRKLNLTSFEWTILGDIPHRIWLDRAWPLVGEYLADIRARSGSAHARVLVMVIPQIAQVVPAERARTMGEYGFSEDEVDWVRPQRELLQQADAASVPVLDSLPEFQAASRPDALYMAVDQHFTALGHRTTAELLARALMARG